MKKWTILGTTLVLFLCLALPAMAQDKMAKCDQIRINVDLNDGSGWHNDHLILALAGEGSGWVVANGPMKGKNVSAAKGQKLRFNFNDGAGHMVDVTPSSKAGSVDVRSGSRPAIVLVDVTGAGTTAAVHFEITGAPNAKAKVEGCPGGNFYIDVQ